MEVEGWGRKRLRCRSSETANLSPKGAYQGRKVTVEEAILRSSILLDHAGYNPNFAFDGEGCIRAAK